MIRRRKHKRKIYGQKHIRSIDREKILNPLTRQEALKSIRRLRSLAERMYDAGLTGAGIANENTADVIAWKFGIKKTR